MELVDRKILSILRYGKKRQSEIVALLDYEKSSRTIRRHLNDLEENNKIAREGDSGLFYLPSQNKDPIRPKPFADQDEVNRVLFNLEDEITAISSPLNEFHDDREITDRLIQFLSSHEYTGKQTENPQQGGHPLNHIIEFYNMTESKYYVLQNKQNLKSFFRTFDSALETLDNYDSTRDVFVTPEEHFEALFASTNHLYNNWFKGKENKEFDSRMTDRAEKILSIFESGESKFHSDMRSILTNISREDSQKLYITMVKSGTYDQERMLEDAFYTYDVFNEIDRLIKDLNDAQQEVEDQTTEQSIIQLKQEVIRLYTREVQEIT